MSDRERLAGGVPEKIEVTQRYAVTVPESRRGLYEKAGRGEASPREAIKANCQFCVGYEDVSSRVGGCQVLKCPLWAYRPYQDGVE